MEKLPKSFLWLLKSASSVLHQHPLSLYHQLQNIENQFMNVIQPIELIDNVLLKQDDPKKQQGGIPKFLRSLERFW